MAVEFGSTDLLLFGTLAVGSVIAVSNLWEDDDYHSYYVAVAIACCAVLYTGLYGAHIGSKRILSLRELGVNSKRKMFSDSRATLSSKDLRVMSAGSALAAFLFVLNMAQKDEPWLRYSAYAFTVALSVAMTND